MVLLGVPQESARVQGRRSAATADSIVLCTCAWLRLELQAGAVLERVAMTKQFKILVVAALVFQIVEAFLLPKLPFLFSAYTLELMKYGGHGARVNPTHPIVHIFYLLPYPALVALYFLRNWGRYLLLAFITIALFGSFFLGASISGPPETFISIAITLLEGAILALAFLSPLKDFFAKPSTG